MNNGSGQKNESENEESKFERLLKGKFSGDVSRTFDAVKSQLEKKQKKETEASSAVENTKESIKRGILLRAFIKGSRILEEERKEGTSISNSENLYNFKNKHEGERKNWNGGRGRVSESCGQKEDHGNSSGPFRDEDENSIRRFPLPSFSSVRKHLLSSKNNLLEIKIIKSKHLRILELDLSGTLSRSEIARAVGCSEPTITNVLKSPAVQEFKRRALSNMEDEYSSLLKPAIAAVRDALGTGQDIELRQDTAFKYLKTQGKGVSSSVSIHEHQHGHIHAGAGGDENGNMAEVRTELSDIKRALLKKLGHDPAKIMEAEFRKVPQVEAGD